MRIMRLKKCTIPLKHHKSSSAVFKYLSNHKGNIFLPNIPSISTASSLKLQVFLPNNSPIKKYALRIKNSWKTMKDHKKATLLATTDKRPRLIWIIKIEKRSIQQSNPMQNLSYKTWLDQWKWETSQVLNPWFFDNLFYSAIKTSSLLFLIIITRDNLLLGEEERSESFRLCWAQPMADRERGKMEMEGHWADVDPA